MPERAAHRLTRPKRIRGQVNRGDWIDSATLNCAQRPRNGQGPRRSEPAQEDRPPAANLQPTRTSAGVPLRRRDPRASSCVRSIAPSSSSPRLMFCPSFNTGCIRSLCSNAAEPASGREELRDDNRTRRKQSATTSLSSRRKVDGSARGPVEWKERHRECPDIGISASTRTPAGQQIARGNNVATRGT